MTGVPTRREDDLTREVLDAFRHTPDDRLRRLLAALVRHAHAFVTETGLTMGEWAATIDFLTRTGQMSSGNRQEFILLSDVLGVSSLLDMINSPAGAATTPSTVLGPFYVAEPPRRAQGDDLAPGASGQPLWVDILVLAADGERVADAVVDVWQADDEGLYDVQRAEASAPTTRARFRTDAHGRLSFWTVLPCSYSIPEDGPVGDLLRATHRSPWRPAHLHFMIAAPGCRTLVTHLFIAGDPHLRSDAVFGVRTGLVCEVEVHPPGPAPDGRVMTTEWRRLAYEFRLAPADA